jgi:hypothetical protein
MDGFNALQEAINAKSPPVLTPSGLLNAVDAIVPPIM